MTIETALQADRADLAVADWLQARMLGELPEIVSHAVKVDYFLSLVMMDGLKLAVDNNQDEVLAIIDAFRAVGSMRRWRKAMLMPSSKPSLPARVKWSAQITPLSVQTCQPSRR